MITAHKRIRHLPPTSPISHMRATYQNIYISSVALVFREPSVVYLGNQLNRKRIRWQKIINMYLWVIICSEPANISREVTRKRYSQVKVRHILLNKRMTFNLVASTIPSVQFLYNPGSPWFLFAFTIATCPLTPVGKHVTTDLVVVGPSLLQTQFHLK